MKKLLILIFMVSLCFLFVGCSLKTEDIPKEKNTKNTDDNKWLKQLTNYYEKYDWNCEVSLKTIKDFSTFNNVFITNDGDLYQYSLEKIFSNGSYCKKIDSDIKFDRFINGAIISTNKIPYAFYENKLIKKMEGWTGGFDYNLLNKYDGIFMLNQTHDGSSFDYMQFLYGFISNNTVYSINNSGDKRKQTEIGKIPDDEYLVKTYNDIIKTNKNFYYYSIVNREECEKYADVECAYGLARFDEISNYYDRIYYFNARILILNDNENYIYTNQY